MNDPDDHTLIDQIVTELTNAVNSAEITVIDQYSIIEDSEKALNLLNLVFDVVIAILMFLCFFSLQAAMTANMFEQSKEIGVLRSIGFTSYRIGMLYFYEALLLVFASCMLGVMIGVLVGFTMVIQQDLFLNLQTELYFPGWQTFEIFLLSVFCAMLSTYGPAYQITKKSISAIFRIA